MRALPERSAGILLHPTSLPGGEGAGTLGEGAFSFIDFCAAAGARIWQICPLGPTGYGDSPYQCLSARAGNPLLVDLEELSRRGWLAPGEIPRIEPSALIDYGKALPLKTALLERAFARFGSSASDEDSGGFASWAAREAPWLDEYCLFSALKRRFGLRAWTDWPPPYRDRDSAVLAEARLELKREIDFEKFVQWNFDRQWHELREYAHARGVLIMGDMPIYVARDSAETWSRRGIFLLDERGEPRESAGVPPDYFSPDGQLWGNPIWNWKALSKLDYAPWVEIVRAQLDRFDILRVDHFRGFSEYWAVPPSEATARGGRWRKGPGIAPFEALAVASGQAIEELPIIAEDLGSLGPRARRLLLRTGFPGMKVLQFSFDSKEKGMGLPGAGDMNYAIYTGTHDNDTVLGWFDSASPEDRSRVLEYLGENGAPERSEEYRRGLAWSFIRAALDAPCRYAIIPAQDILALGSEARMNIPGTADGNWRWRLNPGSLDDSHAKRLRSLIEASGRA